MSLDFNARLSSRHLNPDDINIGLLSSLVRTCSNPSAKISRLAISSARGVLSISNLVAVLEWVMFQQNHLNVLPM